METLILSKQESISHSILGQAEFFLWVFNTLINGGCDI